MSDQDETGAPAEPGGAPELPPAADQAAATGAPSGAATGLEDMSGAAGAAGADTIDPGDHSAADLEAVFDVPVRVSAVLGRTRIPVASLLRMDVGTVVELDRQVGEAIDIYVNDRLVARGEIVLVESRLGITMTEIVKAA